jgi:hypothetical protein
MLNNAPFLAQGFETRSGKRKKSKFEVAKALKKRVVRKKYAYVKPV